MATHRLIVDGWHPVPTNVLMRAHWARRARLRRDDDLAVALAARMQQIPRATGMRRVSLTIVLGPRQRGGDPDSYLKSTLDSLVSCGLLADDRRECLSLGEITYERGPRRATVITLEDLT